MIGWSGRPHERLGGERHQVRRKLRRSVRAQSRRENAARHPARAQSIVGRRRHPAGIVLRGRFAAPQDEVAGTASLRRMFASSRGHPGPFSIEGDPDMAKMRAMVVQKAGGPLKAEERNLPLPGTEEVRIRIQACGVCHSDCSPSKATCRASGTRAFPATKSSGGRRARRGRQGLERRGARRRRLVRRLLWLLQPLPARHRFRMRERARGDRGNPRRRIRHPRHRPVSSVAHVPDDLDAVESAPCSAPA